ncbi:flavin monoamine oxidase family protein [Roseococcus suduntuyensis]|uniref:Tryptophan 2-monooxygenase n=1 Tax=Roseococcus suduntuyensis TaxID=455361 RepID=A0A840AER9_9PROT|nr:NAD(P)/FAD-dependent oxidoreductase [Roseococcus suduntuyensis]MBB3898585.1 monoamine oxidase [Roseococcus suduntuyensis]
MSPSDPEVPPEVLVIGAGCAGIAAARALRMAGRSAIVLEAGGRVGGRAHTSDSLGVPFDHGATWLHQARENPLTAHIAEHIDHDTVRERHLHLGDRFATPEEFRDYWRAHAAFEDALAKAPLAPDRPVTEAAPCGGRWDATIAHWLGSQINGAELERISLEDYVRTDLDGPNLLPREGVGGLVARLAEGLDIRLNHAVRHLRWEGPGVVAEGDFGALRAARTIVTVSTGVLAAGGLRFTPELPPATRDAIAGLPMGLLTKFAFRLRRNVGVAPFHSARRAVTAAAPQPMSWVFRPFGAPLVFGFVGGARAWELLREGVAATEAAARADFAAMFGADDALGEALVTRWGDDPLFLGSYSHARPGHHASRAVLAAPLGEGRLTFAGEATHGRFAGTVAGAWLSGEAAALPL